MKLFNKRYLLVMFFLATILSSCLTLRNFFSRKSNSEITILSTDSLVVKKVYLSFFGSNNIDTVDVTDGKINLSNTHDFAKPMNLKMVCEELGPSGAWNDLYFYVTRYSCTKGNCSINLGTDSLSLSLYEEYGCLTTDEGSYYSIRIKNNTNKYIFSLVLQSFRYTDNNVFSRCYNPSIDNVHNYISPASEKIIYNQKIHNIRESYFLLGVYDPYNGELEQIKVLKFEIKVNEVLINLDE